MSVPPLDSGGPPPAAASPSAAAAPSAPPDPAAAGRWPRFDPQDLGRACAGDLEALGRFFDHYVDRVFAVAHRYTGELESARDITQEVFLKVRRHLARLDVERDPAPWLYTVAINACHDHHRSAWRRMARRSRPIEPGAADLPSPDGDPETQLLAAEEAGRVQAAVARLAPDLRASVVLHDFEGLSHEEIARITRTSHAAARKRHSRAIAALARLLEEGRP